MRIIAGAMMLALIGSGASAQNLDAPRNWTVGGVFVTEGDIANCPYHEVGRLEANVHANTIFGKRPTAEKVVREMIERGRGMTYDAIVKAVISPEHATMVWGRVVTGTGIAIKFAAPCAAPQTARG